MSIQEIKRRLHSLSGVVKDEAQILILMHDNPDPDSLASAFGLQHLLNSLAGEAFIDWLFGNCRAGRESSNDQASGHQALSVIKNSHQRISLYRHGGHPTFDRK